jgi:TolB-like protein
MKKQYLVKQTAGLKIKPILAIIIFFIMAFCYQIALADVAPQVNTDKDGYKTGETVRVNFFNAPGSQRDWICIAVAGSPDTEAGDYKYMPNGLSQGVLTFDAPAPGKYEVRAYYNYSRNGYVVSARSSFSVGDMSTAVMPPPAVVEQIKPAERRTERRAAPVLPTGSTRISVSVFHFTPLSMDASNYGITVTSTLSNAPKMQSSFDMLSRRDLEIFLAANNLQQDEELENIIDIGTRLGLNFIITGNIGKRGSMIITNYQVISVDQRKVIFSDQSMSRGEADLVSSVMKMSTALIEAILSSTI